MGDLVSILGANWAPPPLPSPEQQLRDAISEAGIAPPAEVIMDGTLRRFSTSPDATNDHGWYVAHGDGVPAGAFGDWGTGSHHTWTAHVGRELLPVEEAAVQRRFQEVRAQREEAQRARRERAADTCDIIWSGGAAASDDHPYLARKQVRSHGLRVTGDGRLMVPMYGPDGDLTSLQYIDAQGGKKYHPGGATKACSFIIPGEGDTTYLAEGYATAASIHAATGATVIVGFSAQQLPAVAERHRPTVIVADNDPSGTGERFAREAAALCGARIIMQPEPGDANDWACAGHDLAALLTPPTPSAPWLVPLADLTREPAPIRWLVKRWLQRDSLCMVHGPSGGGKTFLVLDLALTLAAGLTSWGDQPAKPCAVAYLAGEGHHGLRARITAWCQHHQVDPAALRGWLSSSGCDLNTTEGHARTAQALRELPEAPGLIIVDTLHRSLQGDENSAQDAKSMLDACAALQAEFGATVLLVHHTGVSEEAQHRARGSSAWRGALDIEISVAPATETRPITVTQRKAKDAAEAPPLAFDLTEVTINGWVDEDGAPVTSAVLVPTEVVVHAKPSKHERFTSYLDRAWWATGAELDTQGRPYVTRAGLLEFLTQGLDYAAGTAQKWCKPSAPDGMIAHLLLGEIITPEVDGWSVTDPTMASSLLLRKSAQ